MENRKPSLDRVELKRVCFDLAAQVLQERRPIDVEEIQGLADEYFKIADDSTTEEFILGQGRDPNLVLHIVKYLGSRHAIFPLVTTSSGTIICLIAWLNSPAPTAGGGRRRAIFQRDRRWDRYLPSRLSGGRLRRIRGHHI